jgi:hypothetical protein
MKLFTWYRQAHAETNPVIFYSKKYDKLLGMMYKSLNEIDLKTQEKDWYTGGPFSAPESMFIERQPPEDWESYVKLIIAIFKHGRAGRL